MPTKKTRSQRRKKSNAGGGDRNREEGGNGGVGGGQGAGGATGGDGGGGGGGGDGWTIAGGSKKKGDLPKLRTYFKVFASFKCSNERCKKTWHSAHGWEREDDEGGINCELCGQPAELMDAKDEMLKLNTYLCPSPNCFNRWHSIHMEDNPEGLDQDCDICGVKVSPEGPPQERFGRHYWLRCLNKECPEKDCVEWEDFSLTQQKTQRCTKCFSRGDIVKVSKLKQLPFWMWKRNKDKRRGGGSGEGDRREETPSNHVTEFCDMCQDIIRQGKGKNCRQWRVIKTKVVKEVGEGDGNGGGEGEEKIVEMGHFSENPFHYDVRGSKELEERAKEGQRQFVRNVFAAAAAGQVQ